MKTHQKFCHVAALSVKYKSCLVSGARCVSVAREDAIECEGQRDRFIKRLATPAPPHLPTLFRSYHTQINLI
jgi:hypothetical protein